MAKISNETKLVLALAKERTHLTFTPPLNDFQRGQQAGIQHYEEVLGRIVIDKEESLIAATIDTQLSELIKNLQREFGLSEDDIVSRLNRRIYEKSAPTR